MSSTEEETDRASKLIERLLADPAYRAEFRQHPAEICRASGLDALAGELTPGGKVMHTLELRESKSSLAGVVMAVAAEGVGVAELRGLLGGGLHGRAYAAASKAVYGPGINPPHGGAAKLSRAARLHEAGGEQPSESSGAASVSQPAASTAGAGAPAGPGSHPASAADATGAATSTPTSGAAPGAASQSAGAPGAGAAPGSAGSVPMSGGGVIVSGGASAGSGPGGLAELLADPRLSLPISVRSVLAQGGVDPRVVSVLESAVANHSIVVGDLDTVVDPVHAQAIDITSVDGEPVGPTNLAARDLITEIAALDPSVRPNEIGTPWPIQSQGFFTDALHQNRLHLAFASEGEYRAPIAGTLASGTALDAAPPSVPHHLVGQGASAGTAGYVNPLPPGARLGRTDMGVDVDMNPGDPIVAPGTSRVLGIMPDWYAGQPYIALQLLDGPMRGHNYYVAEQIDPAVTAGQVVIQGQVIAHYAASGTGIEIGWAGSNWEQTLAQAQGNTGDASHNDAPAGISFRNFLKSLPAPGSPPAIAETGPPAHAGAPGVSGVGLTPDIPSGGTAGVSELAPLPATASFRAVAPGGSPVRHTVQFLPAVQPPPESPLYGLGLGGQAGTGDQVVGAGALQQSVVGQGTGIAADLPHGSISLTSSLLTSGQEKFAARLSELTGLDPRVISAWELAEESGSAAQGYEAKGYFNWLNIGHFDSGPGKIAFDEAFSDPISAAEQTANFLNGKWGGASSGIRAILSSVSQGAHEQITAIADSGWASSGYRGGANLEETYNELADIQVSRADRPSST